MNFSSLKLWAMWLQREKISLQMFGPKWLDLGLWLFNEEVFLVNSIGFSEEINSSLKLIRDEAFTTKQRGKWFRPQISTAMKLWFLTRNHFLVVDFFSCIVYILFLTFVWPSKVGYKLILMLEILKLVEITWLMHET